MKSLNAKRFESNQDPSMLYISESCTGRAKGYQVRFANIIAAYFSWRLYGSKETALIAAKEFRDTVMLHVEHISVNYRGNLQYKGKKNSKEAIGVSIAFNSRTGAPSYSAYWKDPQTNKSIKREFTFSKYGKDKARELAIEARTKAVGEYPKASFLAIREIKEQLIITQLSLKPLKET